MLKVSIMESPTADDWMAVKRRALVTVGLTPKSAPNNEWKYKILKARHSPIRRLRFAFYIEDIPYCISTHLARHVHAQPYIRSERTDRTGIDRHGLRQDAPVNMIWDINGEELMIFMNKRLCKKADPITQQVAKLIQEQVTIWAPEFVPFMQPMCMYLHECPEMESCGYYVGQTKDIRRI